MKKQVIISKNPETRFFRELEKVESYDITHLQLILKQLLEIAEMVNNRPDENCNLQEHAIMMAHLIKEISVNIKR
jgi:hypothetical protein